MTRLALVVIACNEARCIERCLQSARPLVDEMIVLDTGSTDDTVVIAERMGARVHHFDWCDDFSAARNAALDYSDADWKLVIDADEWIVEGSDQLHQSIRGTERFIGVVPIASEFDLHGRVEVAVSWIPRLLPSGIRYQGRVHEQPVSSLGQRPVYLKLKHDGYRKKHLGLKKGRNRALLLRALEDDPSDAYVLYQIGKDYEIYEDFNKSVDYFSRALRFVPPGASYRHDLVVRTIFSLKMARQHEKALQFAEAELANWQQSPDFFFALGDLMLDCAALNPSSLQELVPMIESSWMRCLEIGDQPELEGSVSGRGSHLAAYNLAVLYDGLGNMEQAAHYHRIALRPGAVS